MAEISHISEEEAARDFGSLIDRALAGEEIFVRRGGSDVILLSPVPSRTSRLRTLGEAIEMANLLKETRGVAVLDDEFASDMKAVHEELNRPMDGPIWE